MIRDGFWKSCNGNVMLTFGLAAVPLLLIAGGAVDYSRAVTAKTSLQAAADAAALAAARADGNDAVRGQYGVDMFNQQAAQDRTIGDLRPSVNVKVVKNVATVKAEAVQPNAFLDLAGLGVNPIGVIAQARKRPQRPVCLLALDQNASDSIMLAGNPTIDAPDCVVQSNSTADDAITLRGAGKGVAEEFCSAGGMSTDRHGFTPPPVGHCPPVANPLVDLAPPAKRPCDPVANSYSKNDAPPPKQAQTDICGGLEIRTGFDEPFPPGLYVIHDGPLKVAANATLRGKDVTFYLVGNNAGLDVRGGASIDIEAPKAGPYAGLAIVQPPDANPGGTSTITGGGDIRFVGTLYMPTQKMSLQGNGQIGNDSAAWSMIAGQFSMQGNPTIVINADFEGAGYGEAKAKTAGGVVLVR